MHTGERLFACNPCSYSCKHSNTLKYHMLSHTGEKPFACKQCNYSCKQSHGLKKHIRKHSAKTNVQKATFNMDNIMKMQIFCFFWLWHPALIPYLQSKIHVLNIVTMQKQFLQCPNFDQQIVRWQSTTHINKCVGRPDCSFWHPFTCLVTPTSTKWASSS